MSLSYGYVSWSVVASARVCKNSTRLVVCCEMQVRPIAEDEMFKVMRSGKRQNKQWKRLLTKVTFVGGAFTRKPPKYERFIRPTGAPREQGVRCLGFNLAFKAGCFAQHKLAGDRPLWSAVKGGVDSWCGSTRCGM